LNNRARISRLPRRAIVHSAAQALLLGGDFLLFVMGDIARGPLGQTRYPDGDPRRDDAARQLRGLDVLGHTTESDRVTRHATDDD